jgi:hypothetical protein
MSVKPTVGAVEDGPSDMPVKSVSGSGLNTVDGSDVMTVDESRR